MKRNGKIPSKQGRVFSNHLKVIVKLICITNELIVCINIKSFVLYLLIVFFAKIESTNSYSLIENDESLRQSRKLC